MKTVHNQPANDPVHERTRALNVVIPAWVHKRARVAAAQSEMPFKDYIARLLETATPIQKDPNEDVVR